MKKVFKIFLIIIIAYPIIWLFFNYNIEKRLDSTVHCGGGDICSSTHGTLFARFMYFMGSDNSQYDIYHTVVCCSPPPENNNEKTENTIK